jgi:hypothetical protein
MQLLQFDAYGPRWTIFFTFTHLQIMVHAGHFCKGWSNRRAPVDGQSEKPASAIAGAGVPS